MPKKRKEKKGKRIKSKSKHKCTQIYKFYSIEGNKIERKRKECPRCLNATFMGEHKDRFTCGRCRFTEMKKVDKNE